MSDDSSRTEFIAIPVVLVILGILFGFMLAADLGAWAWALFTTVLVALGALAIAAVVRRRRHPPAFDAPPTTRARTAAAGDRYRVLVVADEALWPDAFRHEVGPHAGGRPVEAFVIAPALRSRLAHWTGDDSQRDVAETNLATTLNDLAIAGIPARGEVGSDDPIQAADDALRTFEADEVVFVTGRGEGNWLERGVLDAARERYDIRVSHIPGGANGP
jgi:hypothetical protein